MTSQAISEAAINIAEQLAEADPTSCAGSLAWVRASQRNTSVECREYLYFAVSVMWRAGGNKRNRTTRIRAVSWSPAKRGINTSERGVKKTPGPDINGSRSLQAQGEGHKDPPGIWIKQASGPKEEGGQDTPWVHHGTNNSPPPNKDLVTIGGGPSTIQIPDMTFTSKNTMAIQHKDKTAGSPYRIRSGSGGRAPHKDMTDDLTPPRKTTERMVMGSTDDDSEEYAVVTKKRKNRSSPTHDPRTSKKDKVEAPGTRLTELSTDEDSDDTGKEEDAIELTSYDAIDSSISLVLGKLRLLQKKAGSAEKVRDIEKELHSVLRKARMLHEENLTLRAPRQSTSRTIPPRSTKPTQTILVYSKTEGATSEEVKDLVRRTVDPKALGLRVHRVSKIRNGGVAIELEGKDQAKKLAETLQPVVNTREPKKDYQRS
ncbi:hypothetical protein J6590_076256 [Homalodisca vitripennis]|nr:hypothetical protein J6590_076256 [Homalodisca vitripennis]